MSINRIISIKNPILNAFDMVGVDRARDLPVFMTWAIQAENEIGGTNLVKEKRVLDIKGCKAELPCNAVELQVAMLGAQDCSCNDLRDLCGGVGIISPNAFSDGWFLVIDPPSDGSSVLGYVDYEIQNGCLVFYRNLDGQHVTVQYLGQPLDEEGFPKISENHVRAITEYILWQYCKRSKYSSNPLSDSMIAQHQREWFRLCSHARADDAKLNPSEQEDVAQMLSNPYSGRGLRVGMSLVNWNNFW